VNRLVSIRALPYSTGARSRLKGALFLSTVAILFKVQVALICVSVISAQAQQISIGLAGIHSPENTDEIAGELCVDLPHFWGLSSELAFGIAGDSLDTLLENPFDRNQILYSLRFSPPSSGFFNIYLGGGLGVYKGKRVSEMPVKIMSHLPMEPPHVEEYFFKAPHISGGISVNLGKSLSLQGGVRYLVHEKEIDLEPSGLLYQGALIFNFGGAPSGEKGDSEGKDKEEDEEAEKARRIEELRKKGEGPEGLTRKECLELIELCGDEEKEAWRKITEGGSDGTSRWRPRYGRRRFREGVIDSREEHLEESAKQQAKDKQPRLEEDEAWIEAHGGEGHSPCECWELEAAAMYRESEDISIDSPFPDKPSEIPVEGLIAIKGKGNESPGKHKNKDGTDCCSTRYYESFVQIAISLPRGEGKEPKYDGPECPEDFKERRGIGSATNEMALWWTLSSTPGDYGWTAFNYSPWFNLGKDAKRLIWFRPKHEEWVFEVVGGHAYWEEVLLPGLGKVELIVDGILCETFYFKFIFN